MQKELTFSDLLSVLIDEPTETSIKDDKKKELKVIENKTDRPLIPAETAIETFRNAGYKSTASALAELIDNSIESEAENIQVLAFEEKIQGKTRASYKITKVAVYDDGKGMDAKTLQMSLQFGMGTRMYTREGMGRFGVGLPNASISQCQRVEVYSWQGGVCHYTYLDVDEVKTSKKQNANAVSECEMPTNILKDVDGGYNKESGTLIVWEKCDRLDMRQSRTLYNHMKKDLCRLYRHFLSDNPDYGRKVNLKLVRTGKEREVHRLRANDPMYLLTPNNIEGFENEATNIPYGNSVKIEVVYNDEGDTDIVEMCFSIALPKIQSEQGGSGGIGRKHYANNTGISFVRAGREIDFGDFNFFNPRNEMERWWGCEIRFNPVLDELFGVAHHKQSVSGVRYLNAKDFSEDNGPGWQEEIESDLKLALRHKLSKAFDRHRSSMMDIINKRGKGTRTPKVSDISRSTKIANEVLAKSKKETKSEIDARDKTQAQKTKEWLETIKEEAPDLSKTEMEKIAQQKSKLKIDIKYGYWPGEIFFSIETVGGTHRVVINKKHPFYTELYEPLSKQNQSLTDAIDLALLAYARAEEEMYSHSDELDKIRSLWGGYLVSFLKELKACT